MKTKEELNELKTEYETLSSKFKELTEDELGYVTGGNYVGVFVTSSCNVLECNLNPDTCSTKKTTGHCPKEGI